MIIVILPAWFTFSVTGLMCVVAINSILSLYVHHLRHKITKLAKEALK